MNFSSVPKHRRSSERRNEISIIEEFSRIALFIAERTQWNVYFWHDCKLLSDAIFIFCILCTMFTVYRQFNVQFHILYCLILVIQIFIISEIIPLLVLPSWTLYGNNIRADFELSNCESKRKKKTCWTDWTPRRRSAQSTVFWMSYKTSSHYILCLCDRIITWIMAHIKK